MRQNIWILIFFNVIGFLSYFRCIYIDMCEMIAWKQNWPSMFNEGQYIFFHKVAQIRKCHKLVTTGYTMPWSIINDCSYRVFLAIVMIQSAIEKDLHFQRKGYGFCTLLELWTLQDQSTIFWSSHVNFIFLLSHK